MSEREALSYDEELVLQDSVEQLGGSAWEFVREQGGRP